MVKTHFITGTSRGIGQSIAEKLLAQGDRVYGFSRSCSISHENYHHVALDLGDIGAIEAFDFNDFDVTGPVYLINNAGTIGEIGHVGKTNSLPISNAFTINTTAPCILMNKFMETFGQISHPKTILNIGSGAGSKPIDGWATYCATKAALEMFTRTICAEQAINPLPNFKIYTVGPGVVDTEMQAVIRASDETKFSNHQNFVDFKSNNSLKSPDEIATHYLRILNFTDDYPSGVFSLRDFSDY